ncbi:MAG: LemA family protein [Sulfuricurvum sp. PC08-66]|nr:MAG: LemA family protein [Sulfuricurvum sp. PC08-66]
MNKLTQYSLLGLVLLALFYGISTMRGMQAQLNTVESAWAQVENQLQRRIDLIPNLVETVKGYAAHEKELFMGVAEARAAAGQMRIDIANATPEQMAAFTKMQGQLSSALARLLAVRESYPDLKANESFLKLQDELAGTENRLAVERKRFNDEVRIMNNKVTIFPSSIVASLLGYGKMGYFEVEEAAKALPKVSF